MSSVLWGMLGKKFVAKVFVTSLVSKLLAQSLLVTTVLVFSVPGSTNMKTCHYSEKFQASKAHLRLQNTYQGPTAHTLRHGYFL